MSPSTRRWLSIVGIVLFALAYLVSQRLLEQKQRFSSPTVFSRGGGGVSMLHELVKAEATVDTKRTALLEATELEEYEGLIFFAPMQAPSAREKRLILDFVEGGGKLILSFHTETQFTALEPLLRSLAITTSTEKNDKFKNGEPETVPGFTSTLLRANERYAVYSPWIFSDAACRSERARCFFIEKAFGEGNIILMAGLPPIANGLVGRADNRRLAFRLVDWATPLLIDEYHHFFSSKELSELLREPHFLLPLILLFLLALLFLAFAWTPYHEAALSREEKVQPPPLHRFAESLGLRLLDDPRAFESSLRLHADTVARLFPTEAKRAAEIAAGGATDRPRLLRKGRELMKLHHECLRARGRAK